MENCSSTFNAEVRFLLWARGLVVFSVHMYVSVNKIWRNFCQLHIQPHKFAISVMTALPMFLFCATIYYIRLVIGTARTIWKKRLTLRAKIPPLRYYCFFSKEKISAKSLQGKKSSHKLCNRQYFFFSKRVSDFCNTSQS